MLSTAFQPKKEFWVRSWFSLQHEQWEFGWWCWVFSSNLSGENRNFGWRLAALFLEDDLLASKVEFSLRTPLSLSEIPAHLWSIVEDCDLILAWSLFSLFFFYLVLYHWLMFNVHSSVLAVLAFLWSFPVVSLLRAGFISAFVLFPSCQAFLWLQQLKIPSLIFFL